MLQLEPRSNGTQIAASRSPVGPEAGALPTAAGYHLQMTRQSVGCAMGLHGEMTSCH